MLDPAAVREELFAAGLDGWLLYDFRGSNPLAHRLLGLDQRPKQSRRLFYYLPADGEPRKLVHRIERGSLDHLPGSKHVYLSRQELRSRLETVLAGAERVAMEYAAEAGNPYVSTVDAGTVDLIRGLDVEVVSSGDLIGRFDSTLSERQRNDHLRAAEVVEEAFAFATALIHEATVGGGVIEEAEVSDRLLAFFKRKGCLSYSPPIVARGHHGSDCHYETGSGEDTALRRGDFLLLDMWCKVDRPDAPYADVTRCFTFGRPPTPREEQTFAVVCEARDAALNLIRDRFADGEPVCGWEGDRAARDVIDAAELGEFFVHRTGHSMGLETTHGVGTHLDDLETRDERRFLPSTCFTIEPGVYVDGEIGCRTEINVLIEPDGDVRVTGETVQTRIDRVG
ncbi:MAG: Xaa-Pro peptidase family protein [Planctomycetota bacterium]